MVTVFRNFKNHKVVFACYDLSFNRKRLSCLEAIASDKSKNSFKFLTLQQLLIITDSSSKPLSRKGPHSLTEAVQWGLREGSLRKLASEREIDDLLHRTTSCWCK